VTWAKLDDQFHAHRKAKRAWKAHPRALGLHLLALSYCAGQLSDGFVDTEFVEEKLPNRRDFDKATEALVDAGLWQREGAGWRINDWLDYNPSRAEIEAQRAAKAERQRKWRERNRNASTDVSTDGERDALVTDVGDAAPTRPDQSRPDLTPPTPPTRSGGRKREHEAWERESESWATVNLPEFPWQEVIALASTMRSNPTAPEPTVDALRRHLQRVRGIAA
jgi:hypothetical protein